MEIIKKEYEIEKITITPEVISNFVLMQNRRQISEGHVRQIHGALLERKNPIGILIVNKIGGKMRLIDGNHRIEAIKRFYSYKEAYSNIKIDCILKVYTNLSEKEEIEIYSLEAKRKNESHEDRLQLYKDKIIFWKLVQEDFPCKVTIYKNANSIRFRTLLTSLYSLKQNQDKGYLFSFLSKEDLVPFAMDVLYDDYLLLKDFINFFKNVFGDISKDNSYIREHVFVPLLDIYSKNKQYKKMKGFEERFSCILSKNDVLTFLRIGGREASSEIRKIMINHMNKGFKTNLFI